MLKKHRRRKAIGRRTSAWSAAQLRILVGGGLLALLLSACSTDLLEPESDTSELTIQLASNETGEWMTLGDLDGARLSGQVNVIVRGNKHVKRMEFYIDDVDAARSPFFTDISAPFVLPIDTTTLGNGEHSLSVIGRLSSHRRTRATLVKFEVHNDVSQPEPSGPVPSVPEPDAPTDPQPDEPDPTAPPPSPADPEPEPTAPTPEEPVPAATLYVATNGSDSNDGRSASRPFRTIARAATRVKPGDVVYIRGGVYSEYNLNNVWITSGTSDRPITFMAQPGETVIIDGSHRSKDESPTNIAHPQLIHMTGIDWYVFQDLTFRNSAGRGIELEGNHNVVRRVVSYGHQSDGIYIEGDYNSVEYSVVYDNYSELNGGDSADGLKIDSGTGNIVRFLVSYNNSDDGIDLWDSTNTLVEYSVSYENGRGTTGNGQGFKLSNNGRSDAKSVVRFNIAFNNRAYNFTDNGGGGLTLYNNTSWSSGDFGFVFRGRTGKARHTLSNNISYEDGKAPLVDLQGGGLIPASNNNSWDLEIWNPRFLTTEIDDENFLVLASSSPAIDAGVDMGAGYNGSAPDLGANESTFSATRAEVGRVD